MADSILNRSLLRRQDSDEFLNFNPKMNENGSEGRDINEPKVKDCHEGFDHSSKLRPENSILSQIEDSKSYKLFIDRAVQA